MFRLEKTIEFDKWFRKLKDRKAKAKILLRLQRVEFGNLGEVETVGGGISEMKIHFGPGYRIYFKLHDEQIIFFANRR